MQVDLLNNLEAQPVVPDKDCPALTAEQLSQFQRVNRSSIHEVREGRMSRRKYSPRINKSRGENRIKEEWLQKVFGNGYQLVWNGHSHFARNVNTGELFYIFKKDQRLIACAQFFEYHSRTKKHEME